MYLKVETGTLLDPDNLVEKLRADLPHRRVKKTIFNKSVMVSHKNFLTLRRVNIIPNYKKGHYLITDNLQSAPIYLIYFLIMGIYIMLRKKKHLELRNEVISKLSSYNLLDELGK